jgi:O-methyltransferase involved in polyketide biosynthesis
MSITLPTLTPIQESLFLTLGGVALDARLDEPFLGDTLADDVFTRTGYDLAKLPSLVNPKQDPRIRVFDIAVRAKRLDQMVSRFVRKHPDAVVVDLGSGLDTRVFRVDPPATVDWYDVDFPVVAELREQLVPPRERAHIVGADLTDAGWIADLPKDRPAFLVHDGLIVFLTFDGYANLLRRLTDHFPHGELAHNTYTKLAVWAVKRGAVPPLPGSAAHHPGFNDPRDPEKWVPGLKLIEEVFLTRSREAATLAPVAPMMYRMLKVMSHSRYLSRMLGTSLMHYRF